MAIMENTKTTPAAQTDQGTKPEPAEPVKPALFDEPDEPNANEPAANGGEGGDGGKGGEGGEGTDTKPLTQDDISVPEGFRYDEELGKSFLDIVNDGKLSRKELADRLVAMYSVQQTRMLSALAEADKAKNEQFEADMKREKEDWMKQCQADEEFGGQKWEAAQAVIDRGCKLVATPDAVGLMQRYNLNTHPEIVRMFYRAGKLAGEDRGGGSASSGGKMDPAEAIFGESLRNING